MTSMAVDQGRLSLPVRLTSTTSGIFISKGIPAIAVAASSPPTPMAIIPMPPFVGVWLSVPRAIQPGLANLSRLTW
ncbi:hypothetical protein BMS3Bbin07_00284 [bacterium BMS3Bbin07]|nr:hypothetical protein BMS3Bbin07_00284 [bacterium BMS3Bbin07]